MAKPREAEPVSSVLFVDGEPFVVTKREKASFVARRLRGRERALALRLLKDAHAEASARLEPRSSPTDA
jgi:hypothetical protein